MPGSDPLPPARLDHLVIAARDLDALEDFYRRLGFTVGARNTHDWGTENHIIQFDGHFLELIGLGATFSRPQPDAPTEAFAGFLANYLERREGLAMFVRTTDAAEELREIWDAVAIGIGDLLHFERSGQAADGRWKTVAFSLAFAATSELPGAGFFACENRIPENFWAKDRQVHANTVTGVARTALAVPDPAAVLWFLDGFLTGAPRVEDERGYAFDLETSVLAVEASDTASPALSGGGFDGVTFRVADLGAFERRLTREGIAAQWVGASLVVSAEQAYGITLVFSGSENAS